MNFRGCSGQPNRLARCYHSGDTEDLNWLYQTLHQRFPQRQLAAVGFSLGGNVLLKWLGETNQPLQLFAAVAVSVPLVLSECATRLDRGFSILYRDFLLRELKAYMANKLRHFQQLGNQIEADKLRQLGNLSAIRSFWEYDNRVVAPLHGFADVHDYYRRASSRQFLPNIQIPTLLIQAVDDPFMTPAVLPEPEELSANTTLLLQPGGGHVGFIGSRNSSQTDYWLEHCIPAFIRQQLQLS
jgi:predicted alpha/beta-fold hydrolase